VADPSACNLPAGVAEAHQLRAAGPSACSRPAAVVLPAVPADRSAVVLDKVDILALEVVPWFCPLGGSSQ
jgi:hypothetical protein